MRYQQVLDFWFGDQRPYTVSNAEARQSLWFGGRAEDDAEIEARFGSLVERAKLNQLGDWNQSLHGELAQVIVLEQFTRAIFRGTAQAFASDAQALALASSVVDSGEHRSLHVVERVFLLLPFEHAEDVGMQHLSVALFGECCGDADEMFKAHTNSSLEYAVQHRDIVVRFGRFPHRNAALGRASSSDEGAYLEAGAPSFGQ